jgi:hypothetical protein
MKQKSMTLLALLLMISILATGCGSSGGTSSGGEKSNTLTLYYSHAAD